MPDGIPQTRQEVLTMQEEAIRRVREMQERARRSIDHTNRALGGEISGFAGEPQRTSGHNLQEQTNWQERSHSWERDREQRHGENQENDRYSRESNRENRTDSWRDSRENREGHRENRRHPEYEQTGRGAEHEQTGRSPKHEQTDRDDGHRKTGGLLGDLFGGLGSGLFGGKGSGSLLNFFGNFKNHKIKLPFDLDLEDLLLGGLILLLIYEEADPMLILALVYVLLTGLDHGEE